MKLIFDDKGDLANCPLVCAVLGISIGGGKEKSKFRETTKQDVEKQVDSKESATTSKQTDQTQKQSGSTNSTTSQQASTSQQTKADEESQQATTMDELVSSLDDETKGLLQGLVGDLIGGDGIAGLTELMQNRALNADADLSALVDPIVANARSSLEERLGQSQQAFARSAGSSQNTIVQQLGLREAANVEREIASLAATLGFQTRQIATEEQQSAAALSGNLALQAAGTLKGADVSRVGESSTSTTRALNELTDSTTRAQTSTQELSRLLSESTAKELSESLSESSVTEIIDALTKASGRGKTSGASAGLSIGI